ncbi:MAG: hypothetical protein WCL39_03125 [Armatimonadota bacterium]
MIESSVTKLVRLVRGMSLRCRTGIILLPVRYTGREREVAARIELDAVDYAEEILRGALPGTFYLDINAEADERRLDALIRDTDGGDALLVYNFDIALARMDPQDRFYLWHSIKDRLAYGRKALLIAIPQGAIKLLPPEKDLAVWMSDSRIAHYGA